MFLLGGWIMKEWSSEGETWEEFLRVNRYFLKEPLVRDFLGQKENYQLLKQAVENPTKENKAKVDESFRKHFFSIRFTSYLSTILEYSAINYKKNNYRYENRYPLILTDTGGKDNYSNYLTDYHAEIEYVVEHDVLRSSIEDYITDPRLFAGLITLTDSQREILTYRYLYQLKDIEIAQKMGTSQQYISKTHKTILNRLYTYILQDR